MTKETTMFDSHLAALTWRLEHSTTADRRAADERAALVAYALRGRGDPDSRRRASRQLALAERECVPAN
jgi:hypothetical protein